MTPASTRDELKAVLEELVAIQVREGDLNFIRGVRSALAALNDQSLDDAEALEEAGSIRRSRRAETAASWTSLSGARLSRNALQKTRIWMSSSDAGEYLRRKAKHGAAASQGVAIDARKFVHSSTSFGVL